MDNIDPYLFAKSIKVLNSQLTDNTLSITVDDVSDTLNRASDLIEYLADEANHYKMRSKVFVVVNGEEVELDETLIDAIWTSVVEKFVNEAIKDYLNSDKN